MVISIDTSRALRSPEQVAALIRAVHEAAPEDESRAIEWKSAYADLTSAEASFAISRAILGLANRPVAVAAASFEGVGYVLVGVEPGSLAGQHQMPDSAELLNAFHRYTGHGWPHWDPRTVAFEGVNILVITVEPPRAGDRIALLQKSYQAHKGPMVAEGTIFVRRPGATERASRTEIEMLQDRLLSGSDGEASAAREEGRKKELRETVVDLVQAGNSWTDTMQILVIASAGDTWKQSDWHEWVNTDSGREMTENARSVDRNLRRLRLSTDDDSVLKAVAIVQQTMRDNSAFDIIGRAGPSDQEKRADAYRQINAIKSALLRIEAGVIAMVTGTGK